MTNWPPRAFRPAIRAGAPRCAGNANFRTPNLIIHNELDFRVPVAQGMDLFTVLQRKGVPSQFLYFPDEGQWVLKPQNSAFWHETVFKWLTKYLTP